MDYKAFRSREDARAEAQRMIGWFNPRAQMIFWPDHEWATKGGNVWVVAVGPHGEPKYLRDDEFVDFWGSGVMH